MADPEPLVNPSGERAAPRPDPWEGFTGESPEDEAYAEGWAQGRKEIMAERDALRAQLDGMATEWRTKRLPKVVHGQVIVPALREERLVGPWVEVE